MELCHILTLSRKFAFLKIFALFVFAAIELILNKSGPNINKHDTNKNYKLSNRHKIYKLDDFPVFAEAKILPYPCILRKFAFFLLKSLNINYYLKLHLDGFYIKCVKTSNIKLSGKDFYGEITYKNGIFSILQIFLLKHMHLL